MSSHLLVTGGAGFIGSHVAEALLARGDRVTILDDLNAFYDPAIKRANLDEVARRGEMRFVEGDIRDAALVSRTFEEGRFDAVVHLAAMAGVRPSIADPGEYVSVNLGGTTVLLDEVVKRGIPRVVYASSSSVYGNASAAPFREEQPVDKPISPYAATKKAQEVLSHVYHEIHGLALTGLRFFTVYGPRQRPEMAIHRFTEAIDQGRPITMFGDGSSRRDYTYIDDIVGGVLGALERDEGHRIYNLGESATTTLARLIELIAEAVGKEAMIEPQPMQPGDVRETFASIDRARAELAYAPRVPVERGIPLFVDWYRSRISS